MPEIATVAEPNLWWCAALVLAGILFHFMLKLSELENTGTVITPWAYWRNHPYTSAVVVMGAYMLMIIQYDLGQLSYSAAALTGMVGNSLGDKARAAAMARAGRTLDKV